MVAFSIYQRLPVTTITTNETIIPVVMEDQVILILQMKNHPGLFQKGPDPRRNTNGRPQCGKNKALALLDALLAKTKNLEAMEIALQAEFDLNPVAFFKTFVLPFAPKQVVEQDDAVGFAVLTAAEATASMDRATSGRVEPEDKPTGRTGPPIVMPKENS